MSSWRVALSEHWLKGGDGALEFADAVVDAVKQKSKFKFLYPDDMPIKTKIETIATKMYGADGCDYTELAEAQIAKFEKLGWGKLPLCMAKTHLSLSHDKNLKGRPTGFRCPIREVRASVGAGFLYPLLGKMRTIPGMPTHPAGEKVDLAADGRVVGLF